MSVMLRSSSSLWIILVLRFVSLLSANPEGICLLNFLFISASVIRSSLGFVSVFRFDSVDKMRKRMRPSVLFHMFDRRKI